MQRSFTHLIIWTALAVSLSVTLVAQPAIDQLVRGNLPQFEHLFASMNAAAVSPADVQGAFDHLHLSKSQGQVILKISTAYKASDDALKKQAAAVAAQGSAQAVASPLLAISAKRNALLVQAGTDVLSQLDADGGSKIRTWLANAGQWKPKK